MERNRDALAFALIIVNVPTVAPTESSICLQVIRLKRVFDKAGVRLAFRFSQMMFPSLKIESGRASVTTVTDSAKVPTPVTIMSPSAGMPYLEEYRLNISSEMKSSLSTKSLRASLTVVPGVGKTAPLPFSNQIQSTLLLDVMSNKSPMS